MDIGSGYISKISQIHHIISKSKITPKKTTFLAGISQKFGFVSALRAETLNKQALFHPLLDSSQHLRKELTSVSDASLQSTMIIFIDARYYTYYG